MFIKKRIATLFTLSALLMATVAGISGCDKIDETIDEAVDEFLTGFYSSGDEGLTIEFVSDVAMIRDFGDSHLGNNRSVIDVGDIYIKNITRTGPNKWSAEIIQGDYTLSQLNSVAYEPTELTVDGDDLHISNPDKWDIMWNRSKKPDTTGTGTGTGTGDTIYNQVIEGDISDEIIVRFTLPSGISQLTVMTTEIGVGEKNSADMFVRKGADPEITSKSPFAYTADCGSMKPNRENEVCTFQNPGAGQWSVMLYGYNTYFWSRLIVIAKK